MLAKLRLFLTSQVKVEIAHQFQGGDFHLDVEGFHSVTEIVVEPDGRDCNEKT